MKEVIQARFSLDSVFDTKSSSSDSLTQWDYEEMPHGAKTLCVEVTDEDLHFQERTDHKRIRLSAAVHDEYLCQSFVTDLSPEMALSLVGRLILAINDVVGLDGNRDVNAKLVDCSLDLAKLSGLPEGAKNSVDWSSLDHFGITMPECDGLALRSILPPALNTSAG